MTLARVAAAEVVDAVKRIDGKVLKTPLQRALWLENNGTQVYLKLESEQVTGSFKARGAVNKILSLSDLERKKGVITASTGNHALAVTYANSLLPNLNVEIVLPETASQAKVDSLKANGANLRFFGKDCFVSEIEAIRDAKENNKTYVSPYNDMKILAGQGTIACEILDQLPSAKVDAIFVPVGGGGLISGIAAHIKSVSPETKVYGCSPKNDAHMSRCCSKGSFVEVDEYLENGGHTLSEGTAGAVEKGSITFPICQECVDEWLELTEEEIGSAVVSLLDKQHKLVEGAAGLGVAGYKRKEAELKGKTIAIVLCGGNVKATMIRDLLNKFLPV